MNHRQIHVKPNQIGGGKSRTGLSAVGIVATYIVVFWVALPAFLLATGFRLDTVIPVGVERSELLRILSWFLLLAGFTVMALAMTQLMVYGKGLPISHLPPRRIVVSGIYRFLRHPIYVGYTVAFSGLALLLGSFWSLAFSTPLLVAGWTGYVVFIEEPVLVARFGEQYRALKETTGLVIPPTLVRATGRELRPLAEMASRLMSTLANRTILYQKGDVILVSYGVFIALGMIVVMHLVAALSLSQGIEEYHVRLYLAGASLSALVGARLFWWMGHIRTLIDEPLYGLRRTGFVSWGGLFGLLAFSFLFSLNLGYNLLVVSDVLLRALFLGYAIGRIGCLTYGCCYGIVSKRYGIAYQNPAAKVVREGGNIACVRHPTPVYSLIEGVVLFVALNCVASCARIPAGLITAAALLLYSVGRSAVEFLRDRRRYAGGAFTEGHIGCGIAFLVGWMILFIIPPHDLSSAPRPLTLELLDASLPFLPVSLLAGSAAFFIAGFHWREIGTW